MARSTTNETAINETEAPIAQVEVTGKVLESDIRALIDLFVSVWGNAFALERLVTKAGTHYTISDEAKQMLNSGEFPYSARLYQLCNS